MPIKTTETDMDAAPSWEFMMSAEAFGAFHKFMKPASAAQLLAQMEVIDKGPVKQHVCEKHIHYFSRTLGIYNRPQEQQVLNPEHCWVCEEPATRIVIFQDITTLARYTTGVPLSGPANQQER